MEFRILGALEVRDDGDRRIPLGAGKQRAVLAILLLHANQVVPTERLIDELWGGSPPGTARKAIQVYVTRLRKALGAERIRTQEPGYQLDLGSAALDLHDFQALVSEARKLREQGEDARAAERLRDALALWNGPPLADFTYEPFAQTEIPRLEEQRLEALEERIDADLAFGHGGDLVAELKALVARHPYRERLRGQLMLALYRDGRQADALAVYQETRKLLVEELGIEPGPALQRLEGAILRQEPALETVLEEPASAPLPRTRRRRRWMLAAAGAGLALVAGAVAIAVSRSSEPDFLTRVEENSIGVIDAQEGGIEAQVRLPGRPSAVAAGGGFVWVASEEDGTVSRVDPELGVPVQTLTPEGGVAGVAYGGGSLWVSNPGERTVSQITPDTLQVIQTFPVGNGPSAVAFGEGGVWVVNTFDGALTKVDPTAGRVETIPLGSNPTGIAVGAGSVWVTSEAAGVVFRLDAQSGRIAQPINVGNGPTAVAVGGASIWVANRQDGTVSRIDPETNRILDTEEIGAGPTAIAANADAAWVASAGQGTVTRIDSDGGRIQAIAFGSSPSALALADGKVWATALPSPRSHRGGVLRVEADFNCMCIDPGLPGTAWGEWTAFTLAYDGLVAYRRVHGIAGSALVPNLAVRIPKPSDGEQTYMFELRRDLRYSDGTQVQASDFRASLERLLTINPGAAYLYGGIVGAAECSSRRAQGCDLSRGIETDDAARAITIHLAAPDPDLLHALALPTASVLPAQTPRRVARRRPIPGTGPYRILPRDSLAEIRFARNPHFEAWSQDARPDGYPDEIRVHVTAPARFAARLAAVEKQEADLVSLNDQLVTLGPDGLTRLLTSYPGRLELDPAPITFWMFLNTRVPPFDDLRVRRALNFALDRRGLNEALAHPSFSSSPCQLIPYGFPGFRPYCPYTLAPNERGTWTAPDLPRARALIAESGTRGMTVKLASFASPGPAQDRPLLRLPPRPARLPELAQGPAWLPGAPGVHSGLAQPPSAGTAGLASRLPGSLDLSPNELQLRVVGPGEHAER